ncbi:Sulfatase [compost metagenome]
MKELEQQGIAQNTMIVFTSDNGPVLDDGYQDEAVTRRNGHTPAGTLRGGKYSALEGGTRVPFIINWPAGIKPAVSDALVSQIDFIQSFAALLQAKIPAGTATDSENQLAAFLGKNKTGRSVYIEQGGALSIIKDNWKYITPQKGPAFAKAVGIETGNLDTPQLYDLNKDKEEKNNLAATYPDKVKALAALLAEIKDK